jgi:Cdc6-like AAA superfamily ATPase
MAVKRVNQWFHLKDDFTSFKISPSKHPRYFFGQEDCRLRDNLLTSLEECAFSQSGHRAIVSGQAGRGKTHLANHLLYQTRQKHLPLETVYVDCPTIPSAKSPVRTFFSQLFRSIPTRAVKRFGNLYYENKESHPDWEDRVRDELKDHNIYKAIEKGITTPNEEIITSMLGWLGGEPWDGIAMLHSDAPKQIVAETQISRNVGALGEILLVAEEKNLIFLVDEAERFQSIASGEHYWKWLAALREVLRRPAVGLILFIIARNRDEIPLILQEEEIMSVDGTNNIHTCPPYAEPQAKSFLQQLLAAVIRRDPCPPTLQQVLDESGESLDSYPFTQEAFDKFVEYHSVGANVNIPREIINTLEAGARRAITQDKKLIDVAVLQEVVEGSI